ncbi:MAG: hypothetical protein Q9218_002693 [Villophora microphyllina]
MAPTNSSLAKRQRDASLHDHKDTKATKKVKNMDVEVEECDRLYNDGMTSLAFPVSAFIKTWVLMYVAEVGVDSAFIPEFTGYQDVEMLQGTIPRGPTSPLWPPGSDPMANILLTAPSADEIAALRSWKVMKSSFISKVEDEWISKLQVWEAEFQATKSLKGRGSRIQKSQAKLLFEQRQSGLKAIREECFALQQHVKQATKAEDNIDWDDGVVARCMQAMDNATMPSIEEEPKKPIKIEDDEMGTSPIEEEPKEPIKIEDDEMGTPPSLLSPFQLPTAPGARPRGRKPKGGPTVPKKAPDAYSKRRDTVNARNLRRERLADPTWGPYWAAGLADSSAKQFNRKKFTKKPEIAKLPVDEREAKWAGALETLMEIRFRQGRSAEYHQTAVQLGNAQQIAIFNRERELKRVEKAEVEMLKRWVPDEDGDNDISYREMKASDPAKFRIKKQSLEKAFPIKEIFRTNMSSVVSIYARDAYFNGVKKLIRAGASREAAEKEVERFMHTMQQDDAEDQTDFFTRITDLEHTHFEPYRPATQGDTASMAGSEADIADEGAVGEDLTDEDWTSTSGSGLDEDEEVAYQFSTDDQESLDDGSGEEENQLEVENGEEEIEEESEDVEMDDGQKEPIANQGRGQ